LLVRKYKDGYQVLDGHHRFWAYKLLGVKSIPAQVVPDSDIEEISKQGVAEGKQPGKSVTDAIQKVLPIAQEIWFHGSRATRSHRRNSDTDILVVIPDDLVGDQYLAVVRILQKLASHFDNYDIQPTKSGTNIHRIAQEEGRLLWSSKQGVAEDESNDTAISLSKLGKFHPGTDTLAEFVPERATAQYALHPDKWESTFYSLTNKDSDKLKYYGPKKISIPPGTLVGDMAIANKFYRAKTPEEQEQYAELYKASLQPYPVDVSQYRMPELLIPKQGVAEGLTPNTIHKLADRKGIKWDDEPSFLKLTKRLTGKDHLDDLDQTQLQTVKQYRVCT
jgi:predicted nucleotidyltransferase